MLSKVFSNQDGAVLILVLWVIAFLSIIGGYFTLETTLRRNLGFGSWNMLKSRLVIESVLTVVTPYIKEFSSDEFEKKELDDTEFILADGSKYKIKIGGEELSFSIEDERGKIDINKASEELLSDALDGLLGKVDGAIIVDSILDWKDNDDDKRVHGAERHYYESLDIPYEIANSKFLLLEQLLLVRGITPLLFWGPLEWRSEDPKDKGEPEWTGGLQDIFTIYNGSDKLIKEACPKPLIDILKKEYFKEAKGLGTLRFKACAYQACYQVFFQKQKGSSLGFKLIHWEQVPRFN